MHTFIIFVRTAVLDSQPVTTSVVLDSCCSEALHRTMLVWLLRHQSDIMCSIKFVAKHGIERASNVLIPKSQKLFFWNQFKFIERFTCINRPHGSCNRSPNLVNHKIAHTAHKIAPRGKSSPTLKTTDLKPNDWVTMWNVRWISRLNEK